MRERGEILSQLVEWSEVGGSVMYKVLNLEVGEDKSHFLTEILQLFSSVFFSNLRPFNFPVTQGGRISPIF